MLSDARCTQRVKNPTSILTKVSFSWQCKPVIDPNYTPDTGSFGYDYFIDRHVLLNRFISIWFRRIDHFDIKGEDSDSVLQVNSRWQVVLLLYYGGNEFSLPILAGNDTMHCWDSWCIWIIYCGSTWSIFFRIRKIHRKKGFVILKKTFVKIVNNKSILLQKPNV